MPQREGTGALRLWGDESLRDGTPPHGSEAGYRPAVAEPVPVGGLDPTDPAVTLPEGTEIPIQVAEQPTDPEAAAIWDRAFVAEPKAPALVLGPDAKPSSQVEARDQATIAIRTPEAPAPRRRSVGPILALIGLVIGAGAGVAVWKHLREEQTVDALARALLRSRSDTVAGNLESIEALEALHRDNPARLDVRDALAERTGIFALRFDPSGPARQQAATLARASGSSPGLLVARAAEALLRGDIASAEQIATRGLSGGARSAALAYVRARARLDAAQPDAAIQDLQWAENAEPSWPAPVALRIDAERLAGRLVDARESLVELRQHAPASTELAVVEARVEVDAALLAPPQGALAAARQRLDGVVTKLDSRARAPVARLRLAGARIDLARGAATPALETLRTLAPALGSSPELIRALAQAQAVSGDPASAVHTLSASPPADQEATWMRAQVLLQLERPAEARAELGRLGDGATTDRRHLVLGMSAWMDLDSDRAAQELGALDFSTLAGPLADDATVTFIGALSETVEWKRVGNAVQRLGAHDTRPCARSILLTMWANERGALEVLTSATRTAEEGALPACVARFTGRLILGAGDTEAAVLHLRRAAGSGRPSDGIALAEALWRHEGREAALTAVRRIVDMAPTAPRTLLPLVELLGGLDARPELSRAILGAGDPALRAALLARGLRAAGDVAGATAALEGVGGSAVVQAEIARTALDRGDAAAAVAASGPALAVPPALRLEAVTTRILALQAAGDLRQADRLLELELSRAQTERGDRQAVFDLRLQRASLELGRVPPDLGKIANELGFVRDQMSVGSPTPPYLSGQLAERLGQRTEAARLYRVALAIDPTDRRAFAALEQLQDVTDADRALHLRSFPEAQTR
ncbi:MAG: hypothetical protein HY996_11895 [Micrococcales bacterium]|nr:hypothetical protein [Micrococcales bacterium]